MLTQENVTLADRLSAPTPKFFKTLRTVSLILAAVGGAVIAAPVAPIIATIGGYLLTAGTIAGTVSSLPVDFKAANKQ